MLKALETCTLKKSSRKIISKNSRVRVGSIVRDNEKAEYISQRQNYVTYVLAYIRDTDIHNTEIWSD